MAFDQFHRSLLAFLSLFATTVMVPASSSAQEIPKFELLHLWAEDVEAHALSAFSEPMRASGVDWSEHVVTTNFAGVRETFSKRLAHDVPPTASFWIGGGLAAAELIEQGIFRKIELGPEMTPFAQKLHPVVFKTVSYDGGLSVLPLGIHLQNFMVFNRDVLEDIGEAVPESWEDFLRVADKAKQAGYIALSVSDQEWQLRFLLGSIMTEYLSPAEMQALSSDGNLDEPQREAIRATFRILSRLRPYINTDFKDLNWKRSVDHVVEGRAMANALGDFIAPLTSGKKNLLCTLPPANDYVTWSFDSIVLTNTDNPAEILGQELFVDTVLNSEYAADYISRKGGVPVVRDFDIQSFSSCSKVAVAAWQQATAHVQWNSPEWVRAMALVASIGHDHLNDANAELGPTMKDLLEKLEQLDSFQAKVK